MPSNISTFIASLFNLGYYSKAPGTIGSAVTIPFIMCVVYFGGVWGLLLLTIVLLIVALLTINTVLLHSKSKDPSFIIIDEAVGQCITFLTIANALAGVFSFKAIISYALGFILFRLFDIWKPYPVSYFDEKVSGSKGVVFDDVAAGIYATLFLNSIYLFFP